MAFLLVFAGGLPLARAQTPDCQLTFSPQLELRAPAGESAQLQSVVYAIDGDFFELEMPFQKLSADRPLILTLPSVDLEEGMHIVSYYVQTASGEKVRLNASIGMENEHSKTSVRELHSLPEGLQTCACEQLFEDRQPDASNWFNLYKNAEGDHDLFVSLDRGKSWDKAPISGRLDTGCPQFDFARPDGVLAKQADGETTSPVSNLEWTAFPSPFTEKLSLRITIPDQEEEFVIRLIDTKGQVIQQVTKRGSGTLEYDFETSQLAQGPYYISVLTKEASYSRVVIRI